MKIFEVTTRFRRFRSLLVGSGVVAGLFSMPLAGLAQPNRVVSTVTMQAAQSEAFQLFRGGRYAEADAAFAALLENFGNEPELQKESAQLVIRGIRAYLAFLTGDFPEAVARFRAYLERFPEPGPRHAFARFTLAQALELSGEIEEAARAYAAFAAEYPEDPEADLALLREVDLLFRAGQTDSAFTKTRAFQARPGPASIRQQAQLRALREHMAQGDSDAAYTMLAETEWAIDTMPELAVLAFAALEIGDTRLGAGKHAEALRAYRLVPPSDILVLKQEEAIEQAKQRLAFNRMRGGTGMEGAWVSYFEQTVQRMEAQLKALRDADDYTPGFLLRYGTTFLSLGRNREAWIVFRNLAVDERIPRLIREEAHYRWTLAAFQMERWEDALAIAREFRERFPTSKLVPDALYLVARTYQEDKRYRSAIEVLDELLESFPDHRLAPRWLYTRGFNRAMIEEYRRAREDFGEFVRKYPDNPQVEQARLWSALTYDFEKDYPAAIEALEALRTELPQGHPLMPDVRYRIAAALYGDAQYEEARAALEAYVEAFPGHQRIPEAEVLKGDILMGLGELDAAVAAFDKVTIEARSLFPYAVFQIGKILQALEDYDGMIEHFTSYLARGELPANARLSEALYWTGWAWSQKGEPTRALPLWREALDRYGNDPAAREIPAILTALGNLKKRLGDEADSGLATDPFVTGLLAAPTFRDWVELAGEEALAAGRPTYYSRLRLFEADDLARRKNETAARTALLEADEKVALEAMDPEVIGRVGLIYLDFGYDSARRYFEFLLDEHEDQPARAYAWRGLGELHLKEGEPGEAEVILTRLNRELPAHPVALEGKLLLGEAFTALGLFEEAERAFNEVLELKHARGEKHADAMRGLARMNEAVGQPKRAIPYWQKIYNMYRAYPERMAEAYLESARLFEEIGDPGAAFRSVEEMLRDQRIAVLESADRARAIRDRLAPVVRAQERVTGGAAEPGGGAPGREEEEVAL